MTIERRSMGASLEVRSVPMRSIRIDSTKKFFRIEVTIY